jgi:hypothetical protein
MIGIRIRKHNRLLRLGMVAALGILILTASGAIAAQDGAPATSACPQNAFMDVSGYVQTQNYANPELNVTCTDSAFIVESNGITNFEFIQMTPNDLREQDYTWEIPLEPQAAATTTAIPIVGPVAIAINGLPFYGPNEAPRDDYGDPVLDELLDYCAGHTANAGDYHYHALPRCLFQQVAGQVNLVVGYAFDGYEIVAPYTCVDAACTSAREVTSSYQRVADVTNAWEANAYVAGSGDLDECNGMVGADGVYRYYATRSFPYTLACYHGMVDIDTSAPQGDPGAQTGNPQGGPQGAPTGNPPTDPPTGGPAGGPPTGAPPANPPGGPPPGGQPGAGPRPPGGGG